jgi:hypothetical protein
VCRYLECGWQLKKAFYRGFNPWVVIFVGTAIFHIWRGSWQDVAIFGISALLILTQVFGLTKFGFETQPKVPGWLLLSVITAAAIVLYLAPRHGLISFTVLMAFIPIGIALLFYKDQKIQAQPSTAMFRSRIIWGSWATGFALTELVAYVGSKLSGDLEEFPTISVILDPVLDTSVGRAVFVVLWLLSGAYLFGVRRVR